MRTFVGLYDTLRHAPRTPTVFRAMDLADPLDLEAGCRGDVVFVSANREPVTDGALRRVREALLVLRDRLAEASERLFVWPEGRDGGHVVGGGWHAEGTGVVFYGVRDRDATYLCANV